MTRFLTTQNIESAIEDLIKQAKNASVFISPYLQTSPLMLERSSHQVETTLASKPPNTLCLFGLVGMLIGARRRRAQR